MPVKHPSPTPTRSPGHPRGGRTDPCPVASSLHFPELLMIRLRLGYFSLDLNPDRVVHFSLCSGRVCSISRLLSGLYWWNSNMENCLNLFTSCSFFFQEHPNWKTFLGRIDRGPPPTPPSTSPTCGCRQRFTGLHWKVGESCLAEMPSTHLATKSETRGAQGNSCRNEILQSTVI